MNYALSLPSLRTICNSAKLINTPTIGPISRDEIRANIQNVMLEPRREAAIPHTARRSVTIMMDEVAIEEQACYFSHANQVGGLCQKHSTIPLNFATHDSALRIVDELGAERIHFGKEMVFVAARCSNETIIYPVVCAPTCTETWEDMVLLFNLIIEVWGEKAKDEVGDIRNFATDGDHLRRQADHEIFLQVKLGPGDKIYFVFSNIPGLNLFTGPCRILITFDWRHIIKRQDEASVESLLNPDDPQDVPRAIDLLEAIVVLRTPHFVHARSTAATNSDLDAITLLSFMLDALLNVFTLLSASLSEQIYHLGIYAHMSFILFRTYQLKFMSNQLYGDFQLMVKNIVFTVAKQ
ncbi:hypothetical protein B0H13DRAFT_2235085 [Mycena leptocephala]|nr:hypothetical protein B0H13DRAFT_2235085 [Mycena leptocephala]